MSPVIIKEVLTKKDRNDYISFPLKLYRGNRYFVPNFRMDDLALMDRKKNPAMDNSLTKSWLALRDGKVAGRIMGIYLKEYNEIWKRNIARFGWVDFIDDREVSEALFQTVEKWAAEQGAEGISGPQGFTDFDPEGMLIEGFQELGTLPMIYNYPYYPGHLTAMGYEKDADWIEFEIKIPREIPEKVKRVQELVLKRSRMTMVEAKSSRDLLPYARGIFHVLGEAYKDLYGYMPLTEKQVEAYTKQYIPYADPRFTKVVVDENDRVVGFSIAIPSLSRALQKSRGRILPFGWIHLLKAMKNPRGLDLYLVAVLPEYRKSGIVAVIMGRVTEEAIKAGIKTAESNGELETNTDVQAMWRSYEHRQHKRRRCFIKHFG